MKTMLKPFKLAEAAEDKEGPRCPVCGRPSRLTAKGKVRIEWLEAYSHRDLAGEPCRGFIRVRVEA